MQYDPAHLPNHYAGTPVAPSLDLTEFVRHSDFIIEWTLRTANNKAESFLVTCASPYTLINISYSINLTRERTCFIYQITGLQEYTNYTCSITARNIFGAGPPSHAISVMTKSAGITVSTGFQAGIHIYRADCAA